jgi:hypothetical protein
MSPEVLEARIAVRVAELKVLAASVGVRHVGEVLLAPIPAPSRRPRPERQPFRGSSGGGHHV